MLELEGISKIYRKKKAIDNISLTITEGNFLGLVGGNGAGKSTILGVISTIIKPDSGKLFYKGKDIIKNPELIRKELGFVPQDIALYTDLTGADNLKFWGRAYHIYGDILSNRIEEVRKMIHIDKKQLDMKVKTYSGGMKRRLNIGVALLHEPKILVMDEPTVGLDEASRNMIHEAVRKLNHEGTTIIYTGHYMEDIRKLCNQICVLEDGRILTIETKEKQ